MRKDITILSPVPIRRTPEICPFWSRPVERPAFYTERFLPQELPGKTVIIHSMPDDYRSQPAGDAGERIACGMIR